MGTQDSMAETVSRAADAAVSGRHADAELVVAWPRELAARFPLALAPVVVGRRPEEPGAFRLAHPTVSRRHLVIAWSAEAAAHVARDLGSRNGSRVNGAPLSGSPVALRDGTVLRAGDVLLVVERPPAVEETESKRVSRDALPGEAAAMRRLRTAVARAGADPSPVLLCGETGTGKELVARELHRLSGRRGPFLAINCASLSPQLVDAQLFGHARGAFTGAQAASLGLFRAAHGGTLLLDEIGELPHELQAKLLRVLQEHEVLGLGETRAVRVDVRVIAATLRDIAALARAGTFRLDLYARLGLWELHVPALCERRVDLLEWIDRLARRWLASRPGVAAGVPRFDADAVEALLNHPWRDNLRGVDRLVHRLCSEPTQGVVRLPSLAPWLLRSGAAAAPSQREAAADERAAPTPVAGRRGRPSREELEQALAEHGGSVRATAKHYGRERRQIYRWLERYGLRAKAD